MANEKLLTGAKVKKIIQGFTRDELSNLVSDIARACPQAREYLTLRFSSGSKGEVLEKYKLKVAHEFYPQRGFGRLNLREAKKAISDFRKICDDKVMVIDIMLFYVENCVRFTSDYGDINESFYNSACGAYDSVITEINAGDIALYRTFAGRLRKAAETACEGWGFRDCLMDLYGEIVWLDEEGR